MTDYQTDYVIEEASDGLCRLRDWNTKCVVLDNASTDELFDRMEELKAASDRPIKFMHEGEMQDLGELIRATKRLKESRSELNAAVEALTSLLELSLLNHGDEEGASAVIDAKVKVRGLFMM